MPTLNIESGGTAPAAVDVPPGKRLILALTDDAHIDQLHACGGQARCTTCRVQFIAGEPEKISQAEKDLIAAKGLGQFPGVRLSCQIECDADMTVKIISRLAGSGRIDAGKRPANEIQPPPAWTTK